jgi:AraC-like DNA-binding protein
MIYLTFEEFQALLTQDLQKAAKTNVNERLYHTTYSSHIDTPVCKGKALNILIREGITLIKAHLIFMQDTSVEMKSLLPQIGFAYCLKGHLAGYRQNTVPNKNSELQYELSARKGMIYVTAASEGWMKFEKGKPFKAVYLLFGYEAFRQLIGEQLQAMPEEFIEAMTSENGFYVQFTKLSSQVIALGEAIFDNPYSGKSAEFYREAKVIELIAYQIDELIKPVKELHSTGVKLTAKEETLMEYCYQMLLSSLENPPSLIELAREINMSDYRLKNGFRQKYGLSPYRFVVEHRMLKAKELLIREDMTVSEVAMAVGFTSLGSFSNSFYEKFGIRPSELK